MSIHPYGDRDLYVLTDSSEIGIKVGSATYVERRLPQLQSGNPRPLRIKLIIGHAGFLESFFHTFFAAEVMDGGQEWYPNDSLAAETIRQWRPFPSIDKGSLIQTFGEAVHAAMRVRGVLPDDHWRRRDAWIDFDARGFEIVMEREAARRDEHHRRAEEIVGHCRALCDEVLEVPPLRNRYDLPPIIEEWEGEAAYLTDRWTRRDEIAEHDRRLREFLRREQEAANG